jgi:hypothetical protein
VSSFREIRHETTSKAGRRALACLCAVFGMGSQGVYRVLGLDDDAFDEWLAERLRPRRRDGDGKPVSIREAKLAEFASTVQQLTEGEATA